MLAAVLPDTHVESDDRLREWIQQHGHNALSNRVQQSGGRHGPRVRGVSVLHEVGEHSERPLRRREQVEELDGGVGRRARLDGPAEAALRCERARERPSATHHRVHLHPALPSTTLDRLPPTAVRALRLHHEDWKPDSDGRSSAEGALHSSCLLCISSLPLGNGNAYCLHSRGASAALHWLSSQRIHLLLLFSCRIYTTPL